MILSDVLKNDVFDADGSRLGRVIDVRFEIVGAAKSAPAKTILRGLVVSPRSGSSFLGYERNEVNAPFLIAWLLNRRHRGAFFVEWSEVSSIDRGTVALRRNFTRYNVLT
ncbi:MAG: hypothetical protein JWR53_1274 [Glaciihabitans sp.]|jgi:sporulation protein YlmC with PRC-barrel domain|nr:hypothetical protein [Glaciihabitans sp.]